MRCLTATATAAATHLGLSGYRINICALSSHNVETPHHLHATLFLRLQPRLFIARASVLPEPQPSFPNTIIYYLQTTTTFSQTTKTQHHPRWRNTRSGLRSSQQIQDEQPNEDTCSYSLSSSQVDDEQSSQNVSSLPLKDEQPCYLPDLHLEIRNEIYRLVLVSKDAIEVVKFTVLD